VNNKLITLLETFSKEDLFLFKKLVNSSYFNENESISKLLEVIYSYLKETNTDSKKYTKEAIWKKIFPKTSYQDTKYRRLFSDLNKLAAQFLLQESIKKPLDQQINLLKIYNRPELEKYYNYTINTIDEIIIDEKQCSDYYYKKFVIAEQQHLYSENDDEHKQTNLTHIEHADYYLECFYTLQKLKFYCDNLGYNNLYKKTSNQYCDFRGCRFLPSQNDRM